jgi:hypothetical protein
VDVHAPLKQDERLLHRERLASKRPERRRTRGQVLRAMLRQKVEVDPRAPVVMLVVVKITNVERQRRHKRQRLREPQRHLEPQKRTLQTTAQTTTTTVVTTARKAGMRRRKNVRGARRGRDARVASGGQPLVTAQRRLKFVLRIRQLNGPSTVLLSLEPTTVDTQRIKRIATS